MVRARFQILYKLVQLLSFLTMEPLIPALSTLIIHCCLIYPFNMYILLITLFVTFITCMCFVPSNQKENLKKKLRKENKIK